MQMRRIEKGEKIIAEKKWKIKMTQPV